jgi:hypothetical protein
LMQRLKSRAARIEAENTRTFIAAYRAESVPSPSSEAKLDALLTSTTRKAEELRQRAEKLAVEVAEEERKLEKVNALREGRATETELRAMDAFERSQRRIQEDKREEDLQKERDEVQANYSKVYRRWQNEQIELRDFKVILREYKRVRLEKLQDTLGRVSDGRRLRACVREMIRHGQQRILQKLEAAGLPMEPWMYEVLVNCCHVEINIEEAEERLLRTRREALKPIHEDVQALLSQPKQERFDNLFRCMLENRIPATASQSAQAAARRSMLEETRDPTRRTLVEVPGPLGLGVSREQEEVLLEMRSAEANIAALRRLLHDLRENAAAVICNRIRQVEKGGGQEASREAMDWGYKMLSMLVSEDIAKTTMKELRKSSPQAKLTL